MAYYEHIAVLPNDDIICTICDAIIRDSNSIEAHLHDRKHTEAYKNSLMNTNNIAVGISDLYCYICNCRIVISELISHVQSASHQNKYMLIKELVDLDGGFVLLPEKTSGKSSAYCIICDSDIVLTVDSIKEHVISTIHKRARAMVLQPLNGIFSVEDNDDYLWCKICQIFFDNYVELIFQHIEESDHAKKIAKILRLIDRQDIDINNYLQNHKEDKALCTKCGIEVPCNVDNLQSHINGKKHKS